MPNQPSIFNNQVNRGLNDARIQNADRIGPGWNDLMYSEARRVGFASANRYLVLIMPNARVRAKLGMNFIEDTLRLAIRCKSIALEAQAFFTAEESTLSPGPVRAMPYKRNTANTTGVKLSYYMGGDMFEKVFFESWMNSIQDNTTKQFDYYDNYAKGSDCFLLLLPNMIQNVTQAISAMISGKITGFHLTEVYPYSYGIPSLQGGGSTEPLSLDVNLMYREIRPMDGALFTRPDSTTTTIPRISISDLRSNAFNDALSNVNSTNAIVRKNLTNARDLFVRQQNASGRANQYRTFLEELNGEIDIAPPPRGVDGRLVYKSPRFGGLDLGLSILSQTQGFFGAGYFGP